MQLLRLASIYDATKGNSMMPTGCCNGVTRVGAWLADFRGLGGLSQVQCVDSPPELGNDRASVSGLTTGSAMGIARKGVFREISRKGVSPGALQSSASRGF